MPQAVVSRTVQAVKLSELSPSRIVYDIGENTSGKARITVSGETGTEIKLEYSERLNGNKDVNRKDTESLIEGEVQVDRYILKGSGREVWEPEFVYHGFQFIRISITGNAEIIKVEGRIIHTGFEVIGSIKTADDMLNKLQAATIRSYLSNYVGIPTDCPHREKKRLDGRRSTCARHCVL